MQDCGMLLLALFLITGQVETRFIVKRSEEIATTTAESEVIAEIVDGAKESATSATTTAGTQGDEAINRHGAVEDEELKVLEEEAAEEAKGLNVESGELITLGPGLTVAPQSNHVDDDRAEATE